MRYYTAAIHKDAESAFGLTFPEIPGCFAASDTWEGIPAAGREAVELWFEDNDLVAPWNTEELGRHPAMVSATGFVMIPYIPADSVVERINVTMERGLLQAIDETAKAKGMTRSSFLAMAARHQLTGA